MISQFLNWYAAQLTLLKGLITFTVTVFAIYLLYLITILTVSHFTEKVMEPISLSEKKLESAIVEFKKPSNLPDAYFITIKTQFDILKTRKDHHLKLANLFFRNYYSVLLLTMFISAIGGVILFVMINKGWANAGITLQAFFLALVCAITYLGFFPLVFKQERNFADNMKVYERYIQSEVGIYNQLSYLSNPIFPTRTDTINKAKRIYKKVNDTALLYRNIDTVVARNNKTIIDLTNFVIALDAKELRSISDVYQSVYNTATAKKDSIK